MKKFNLIHTLLIILLPIALQATEDKIILLEDTVLLNGISLGKIVSSQHTVWVVSSDSSRIWQIDSLKIIKELTDSLRNYTQSKISAIYAEDSSNCLWIGTWGDFVIRYSEGKFYKYKPTFKYFDNNDNVDSSLQSYNVIRITRDEEFAVQCEKYLFFFKNDSFYVSPINYVYYDKNIKMVKIDDSFYEGGVKYSLICCGGTVSFDFLPDNILLVDDSYYILEKIENKIIELISYIPKFINLQPNFKIRNIKKISNELWVLANNGLYNTKKFNLVDTLNINDFDIQHDFNSSKIILCTEDGIILKKIIWLRYKQKITCDGSINKFEFLTRHKHIKVYYNNDTIDINKPYQLTGSYEFNIELQDREIYTFNIEIELKIPYIFYNLVINCEQNELKLNIRSTENFSQVILEDLSNNNKNIYSSEFDSNSLNYQTEIPIIAGKYSLSIIACDNKEYLINSSLLIKPNEIINPTAIIYSPTGNICYGDVVECQLIPTNQSYRIYYNAPSFNYSILNNSITIYDYKDIYNLDVYATNKYGCTKNFKIKIPAKPRPLVVAHREGNKLRAIPVNDLYTNTVPASYQWYFNDNPISNGTSDEIIIEKSGKYKVFVVDTNGCTNYSQTYYIYNTKVDIESEQDIEIFPNPSNGFFYINFSFQNSNIVAKIYNNYGNEILFQNLNLDTKIDISNQPNGIYLLKIIVSQKEYTYKLIKY